MVELEQYKFTVNQYKEPMKELGVSLALSHKHEQIKELESEMREEGFWNDPDKAQKVTRSKSQDTFCLSCIRINAG